MTDTMEEKFAGSMKSGISETSVKDFIAEMMILARSIKAEKTEDNQ